MKLYIMRHGEYNLQAIKQSLTSKGIAEIHALANFLKPLNLKVGMILHSEKPRAIETAAIMQAGFICPTVPEVRAFLNPLDDIEPMISELSSLQKNLLLVGHLPYVNKLLCKLLGLSNNEGLVNFYTGSLACVKLTSDEVWTLEWLLKTSLLPAPML